jgi:hypothetical protein
VSAAVAAAAVASLGVATAQAASSPSKADFIRRGDSLCRQAARELVPIRRRAEAAKSAAVADRWKLVADLWADQIRVQVRFNSRLRAVGTPVGDEEAEDLLRSLDRGVVLARRVQRGFADRDTDSLQQDLPNYIEFTLKVNRKTRLYGFRFCGRD